MTGRATHGHTRGAAKSRRTTREFNAWIAMRGRCENPKTDSYPRYGARGITVCERWHSFENFLADMGPCPPGMSIDRNDNDGNYEPGNCRWATDIEQANKRSNNHLVTHADATLTIAEWARRLGISYPCLLSRIHRGVPLEIALNPATTRRDVRAWRRSSAS